ncbi:Imm70 family immunity protein [Stenotrophomonas sp. C4297]|uniref:Imm70 family immunity protein n=1 Tax=Stenotrophomonas sp. C4297 TaxID=3077847 RepID=UPI00293C4536|nr:Imm70 family immunity protein [Stenotrophomonas sp. C4297]MDV3511943.1 Imm70 family immunity protein [Stenotrophomonas sp. C4297]
MKIDEAPPEDRLHSACSSCESLGFTRMTVGIRLGQITDEIGSSSFLYAFFSTISGNLEPDGWGSRFPILMRQLYAGRLQQSDAADALAELHMVRRELADLPPARVIWSLEDRTQHPPWGDDIAPDIDSLATYFVTAHGRDLIALLAEVFEALQEGEDTSARIVDY